MENGKTPLCAICGEPKQSGESWFLIADNRWQDKLRILQWNDHVAAQAGVFHACSAEHVQELVVHWMTTGSLDYPFARLPQTARSVYRRNRARDGAAGAEVDTSAARQIGELAVHRESMWRVLNESPHSLTAILEVLLCALRKSSPLLPAEPHIANSRLAIAQEV